MQAITPNKLPPSFTAHERADSAAKHANPNSRSEANERAAKTDSAEPVDRASNFDIDALVDTVWGFAASRISQVQASGASEEKLESMWQAAEEGVKQGFGEAKSILESMDELSEPLKLKIDSAFGQIMDKLADRDLSSQVSVKPEVAANLVAPASANQSLDRSISLYQYERQTFALNLTTAQGDEILIRSVAEQESSVDDQRFGRQSSTQWGTSQSSGYSLMIKGDLNEQEAADLDALLAQVNELANEFYEGDFETAFNMAKELNIDGTSLQSMDLSMQEVETRGASVYAETAGQATKVPRGLEPLKAYADKLIAAQNQWESRFNSAPDFINSLSNHPLNNGSVEQVSKWLMG